MKLWIRSQDRNTLIRANDIRCSYGVSGYIILVDDNIVGRYSSNKRALEVLDEIQDLMRNLTDSDLKIIQYEMPKE